MCSRGRRSRGPAKLRTRVGGDAFGVPGLNFDLRNFESELCNCSNMADQLPQSCKIRPKLEQHWQMLAECWQTWARFDPHLAKLDPNGRFEIWPTSTKIGRSWPMLGRCGPTSAHTHVAQTGQFGSALVTYAGQSWPKIGQCGWPQSAVGFRVWAESRRCGATFVDCWATCWASAEVAGIAMGDCRERVTSSCSATFGSISSSCPSPGLPNCAHFGWLDSKRPEVPGGGGCGIARKPASLDLHFRSPRRRWLR